jgi:predicted PurR-regulated permease PerM
MFNSAPSLVRSISVFILFFLVIGGLYFARQFLIPIAISALLAMLLVPLSRWFENKSIPRTLASLLCLLFLLSILGGIIYLVSWQASGISENLYQLSNRIEKIIEDIRQFIVENIGITTETQMQWMNRQPTSGSGAIGIAGSLLSSLMSIMVKCILVLVYVFLFLSSRSHIKKFILMLVPATDVRETEKIISDAGKVSQKYLSGLGMMIAILWLMYGIGFSIVGVKSAIFFAVLCGLLEIIPFIGNLTGTSLTVLMVISQGGSNGMVLGVFITYMMIQFIQTYILEPLVVGSEVNINPLFTILVLVLMEIIWGIPGMIMAIPILGIVKIICDHIEPLKPFGYLIGKEKSKGDKLHSKRLQNLFAGNKKA